MWDPLNHELLVALLISGGISSQLVFLESSLVCYRTNTESLMADHGRPFSEFRLYGVDRI
jgi:hypothetical protein